MLLRPGATNRCFKMNALDARQGFSTSVVAQQSDALAPLVWGLIGSRNGSNFFYGPTVMLDPFRFSLYQRALCTARYESSRSASLSNGSWHMDTL